MKDRIDAILRAPQARYLDSLLPARKGVLAEMEGYAAEHGVPISDPETGCLLQILARAAGAGRVLEIGTAIGYGALWMVLGAPEARITAIDRDGGTLKIAHRFLERAGVVGSVELIEGEAAEIIPDLQPGFDLVYLDADKGQYRRLLDLTLPKLRVGGLMVVDHLLWKGWIAEPPDGDEDEDARTIEAFNGYFMMHPQLSATLLPLGDGVGLATKMRSLITEVGGPF